MAAYHPTTHKGRSERGGLCCWERLHIVNIGCESTFLMLYNVYNLVIIHKEISRDYQVGVIARVKIETHLLIPLHRFIPKWCKIFYEIRINMQNLSQKICKGDNFLLPLHQV